MSGTHRIEICGGIATGKTTLAHALARHALAALVLEDFRANPFWKRFYEAPTLFAPEKNVCFLAQHSGEIKANLQAKLTVCDYAVVQDLAYARLRADPEHQRVMELLYEHLYAGLPVPTRIVCLRADPAVQLTRIRARGRSEEDPITVDYLRALNAELDMVLAQRAPCADVLDVRSDEIDFANDDAAAHDLAQRLLQPVR